MTSIVIEFQPTIKLIDESIVEIEFPLVYSQDGSVLYNMVYQPQCEGLFGIKTNPSCKKVGNLIHIYGYDLSLENTSLERVGVRISGVLSPYST